MIQRTLSAYDSMLKAGGTIADREGQRNLSPKQIAEAIPYRNPDSTYWA